MSGTLADTYLNKYLDERYDNLCKSLLSKKLDRYCELHYKSYGMNFSNIFEELVFVTLYESNTFYEFQKNISTVIFDMLNNMSQNECDLLSLIDINYFNLKEEGNYLINDNYSIIVNEILTLVNKELVGFLSKISDEKYDFYVQLLIKKIKNFAFNGSVINDDYNTNNYWEEYCVIVQEGYDTLYEICHDDIYNFIINMLNRSLTPDIRILYSGTDELWVDDHCDPFPSEGVMLEVIASKLYDMVSQTASNENINHLLYDDEVDADE